ncbi:MAG: hypothetical protein AB9869_26005 [Verrucomicrobiia bacterium]
MKGRYTLNANGWRRIEWLLALGWEPGLKLFSDANGNDRDPDLRVRPADKAAQACRPKRQLDGADIRNSMTWRPE